jgi:hypothetical protein
VSIEFGRVVERIPAEVAGTFLLFLSRLDFFFAPLFPVSDCPRVDNVGSSASLSLLN